ncbi:MAG: YDG domain-containing protein, partial [bacterium]
MTTKMFWATMLAGTCLWPALIRADAPLPTDPRVVAGDVTVSAPSSTQMLIQQSGVAAIVDWGSFSIANGFGVQFNNGSGATLNRVTGNNLSGIYGSLNATGSVYLINQNGIVFGKSGVVNTGGRFVASTLDITNQDFMNGGDNTFRGDSDAYVVNLGSISSLGGDVALLARNVRNDGTITAPNGTVGLIAGREVLMRDASVADGMFSVRVGGSDTSVGDSGSIRAAAAELRANGGNVYALAGNTDGTIVATGVAKVKGRVFLTAGDTGHVKVDKKVKAVAANGSGGKITVDAGHVDMAGTLDASGSSGGEVRITSAIETVFTGQVLSFGSGVPASGGFAEVSGAHLTFHGTVDTGGGVLLIDPSNTEITTDSALLNGASIMDPASIISALATGNVIVQTSSAGNQSGTILVTSNLLYNSRFSLSLLAEGDLIATASIKNSNTGGTGDINLVAGWDGTTGATVFDSSVFDAAVLGSQTLFGNNINHNYNISGTKYTAAGNLFIGQATSGTVVSVGSLAGATRAYANSVVLHGSDSPEGSGGVAQLGYEVDFNAIGPATGEIMLRAEGDVSLISGTQTGAAAQIGHGGINNSGTGNDSLPPSMDTDAQITVDLIGDLTLQSSGAIDAYTMIGNGNFETSSIRSTGLRGGDITVTAVGEISLEDNNGGHGAVIGHGNVGLDSLGKGNITITAAAMDQSASATVGSLGEGSVDFTMLSDDLEYGNVEVTVNNSGLRLIGSSGGSSCECSDSFSASNLIVWTSDKLVLDSSFHYSNLSSGSVALQAGAGFFNEAGATALATTGGKWLVYSARPDQNTGDIGTLAADFIQFGTFYDATDPFGSTLLAGNGLVYAESPVITVESLTTTYGDTVPTPGVAVTISIDGSTISPAAFGFSVGTGFLDNTAVTFSSTGNVNAGSYVNALNVNISATTAATVSGLFFFAGTLTVDQAILTASMVGNPTKIYDGTTTATLTVGDFNLSGFVTGEGATVSQTSGTYASADAAAVNAVTVALGAGDFAATSSTDLANYVLPTTATGNGTITQATLTGSVIGTPTKVYDGTTAATLTAANYLLSGFVTGEGATVGQTAGTYASANASATDAVTVTLAAGDFAGTGLTNLANYVLPTTVTGNGAITQATLTSSIIGTPTKVYDGTTAATLTAANYLLSGFVTGEGATISQTSGTYASANASATDAVTVTLAASDFALIGSTSLANYVVPTTATGNGVITQAILTGSTIIGTPTKVYDGTNSATLTAANFLLTGFVSGEGATVSKTTGTYATADAAASNTVTVTLAAGDFVRTGTTNLANYVLPTTVTGNGAITQATL